MFMRIAVACFALYCVHGAQNTARDGAALAEHGAALAREAGTQAPKAALAFCLENQSLCAKAVGANTVGANTAGAQDTGAAATLSVRTLPIPVEGFPLPPRRPAGHKKA